MTKYRVGIALPSNQFFTGLRQRTALQSVIETIKNIMRNETRICQKDVVYNKLTYNSTIYDRNSEYQVHENVHFH